MVDAEERVLFASDNGRYVFTGPAWDLWYGAKLETLEEGARLAARADLKRLGLDPASLGALDLGSGQEDVVAFVDPAARTAAVSSWISCRTSPSATASGWCPGPC